MSRIVLLLPLFGVLSIAGCSNNPNADEMLSAGSHGMGDAMASAKRVSGDGATVLSLCEAIGYDSNSDGVDDTFAMVVGKDFDGDTFAVVPTNLLDITADGEYGCVFDELDGFGIITDLAEIGADCDDTNAAVGSGSVVAYTDADNDGVGTGSSMMVCGTGSGTGYSTIDGDCDDTNASINPAAEEICDGGVDNDCDTIIDAADMPSSQLDLSYLDGDGDGYGDFGSATADCGVPSGYVSNAMDCDDTNASINPVAEEICDGVDNDCVGSVDEGATDASTWYLDGDSDGSGFLLEAAVACTMPAGYADDGEDCDDADPGNFPGNLEVCDNRDNNCVAGADDGLLFVEYFVDGDADGFGDGEPTAACADPGPTFSDLDGDCDDANAGVYPGNVEVTGNGLDDDCNGSTSDTLPDLDTDGDGYPASTDCNDSNADINPGEAEVCNNLDDNCGGGTDEGVTSTFYADADQDGFGDPSSPENACSASAGYVDDDTDCNDLDVTVYPGADEIYDGQDNNCSGLIDEEIDNDGIDNNGDGRATDKICVTANTATYPFMLQITDMTVNAWTPNDTGWLTGYGTGYTRVCGSFPLIAGNTVKLQGGFDQDGDGLYGEETRDYWLWMLSMTNSILVEAMGMDVTSLVVATGWDGNGDGLNDGNDGVIDELPELPTE